MVLRRFFVSEKRMTFGGHLEELRQRIINAILSLAIAAVVCLVFFQDPLMRVVLGPHNRASAERAKVVAYNSLQRANSTIEAVIAAIPELSPAACLAFLPEFERERILRDELVAPLTQLVEAGRRGTPDAELARRAQEAAGAVSSLVNAAIRMELTQSEKGANVSVKLEAVHDRFARLMIDQKGRLTGLLKTTAAETTAKLLPDMLSAFATVRERARQATGTIHGEEDRQQGRKTAETLSGALEQIEKAIDTLKTQKGSRIVAIKYTEQFFTYLKIVLIAAIFLAHPFILWQVWRFIGAGLYPHEQKVALMFVPFSLVLFMAGISFGYGVLIPWGLSYLSTYGDPELMDTVLSLSAYLSLFMSLTILLGIVFQVPLVMFFLSRSGLVEPKTFSRVRRHAILSGVILGALLTPPDPFTQCMLAGPLVILYEIGILVSKTAYRRAQEAERRAEETL